MDLHTIRAAERAAHETMYTQTDLYSPGTWLSKPVKSVLELFPLLEGRKHFRALDLACGVGRNSIPVAKAFPGGMVDCVDILPMAVDKLLENAAQYGVRKQLRATVSGIDDFFIEPQGYDLILAISALEHMDSRESMVQKLIQIREGLRPGGIFCMVMNTDLRERDKTTGHYRSPQFEVQLSREEMGEYLHQIFGHWQVLKEKTVFMSYDTPRPQGIAVLESQVLTFSVRKEEETQ